MKNIIDKFSYSNNFSFYAPFLRVFIVLYLLKDVIVMWSFNDLIYRGKSFLYNEQAVLLEYIGVSTDLFRDNFYLFYFFYITLILLFLFGIGKRFTALLLFFSVEIIQNLAWTTLNGGDNLLKFVILYFVFVDSFSRFSIKPITYKKEEFKKLNNFVSNIAGYSICIHFCLVYFVSAVHKLNADVWFNGVATYYVLGSERFQGTPWNLSLIKNGVFVTLSTYGTILIELGFPFLVWFKKTRNVMILLAISLHMGIGIFMMLYDFQILFVVMLGVFVSQEQWELISRKVYQFFSKIKVPVLAKTKLS